MQNFNKYKNSLTSLL